MNKDDVHLKASKFAHSCIEEIIANRESQKAKALTHNHLQGAWLNLYDGFSAGYRKALKEIKDDNT